MPEYVSCLNGVYAKAQEEFREESQEDITQLRQLCDDFNQEKHRQNDNKRSARNYHKKQAKNGVSSKRWVGTAY
jgi:hypothetical protein